MAEKTTFGEAARDPHLVTSTPNIDYQRLRFQASSPTTENRHSQEQLDSLLGKTVPSREGMTQDGMTMTMTLTQT
jgi:hypothetical protein